MYGVAFPLRVDRHTLRPFQAASAVMTAAAASEEFQFVKFDSCLNLPSEVVSSVPQGSLCWASSM